MNAKDLQKSGNKFYVKRNFMEKKTVKRFFSRWIIPVAACC